MAKAPKFWILMIMVAIVVGIFIFKGCSGGVWIPPTNTTNQTNTTK